MFDKLQKKLYFNKIELLFKKGLEDGSIVPFDDEFYEKMNHTYVSGIPVSIHIKHLRPNNPPMGCIERSLYMFFCFSNALLVRSDTKYLESQYGKDHACHGWIEMGGYCYDPTYLLRFKKETYYEIFKPYNICKATVDEYKNCCDSNKKLYDQVTNTELGDFLPNGRKRMDLGTLIPFLEEKANNSNNPEFKKDLLCYLNSIQYDENQINERLNAEFQETLQKFLEESVNKFKNI